MAQPHEYIELFHLLFLEQLSNKLDKKLYVLKGGCNLRFYFKSIRYSEDIDFDIKTIAVETLRNKVNGILNGLPFRQILRARKITIANINESKQSETTQRWKLQILTPFSTLAMPTKIEFSRRSVHDEAVSEIIDQVLLRKYLLAPFLTSHYTIDQSFAQKFLALAHRSETQARDIFDIYWLSLLGAKIDLMLLHQDDLELAKNNANLLSFNDFRSQVIAYLPDEYQSQYDDPKIWENMVIKAKDQLRL